MIAVYDFGGGTFDISILEVGEGVIEVKATNGDTHLGGDNIDHKIVEWLIGEGARVNGTNRSGETALIIAVQQRDLPVVRQLLKAGANPDKSDAVAGYSARDYALRDTRSREILKLIEAAKPKPGATAAK